MTPDHLVLMEKIALAGLAFMFPHGVMNLILMAKLNPLFDPDLRPAVSQQGFKAAYWRALSYTGAVATRRGRAVKGWLDYDFFSKVGAATVFWCRVSILFAVIAFVGGLLLGIKLALEWWLSR